MSGGVTCSRLLHVHMCASSQVTNSQTGSLQADPCRPHSTPPPLAPWTKTHTFPTATPYQEVEVPLYTNMACEKPHATKLRSVIQSFMFSETYANSKHNRLHPPAILLTDTHTNVSGPYEVQICIQIFMGLQGYSALITVKSLVADRK